MSSEGSVSSRVSQFGLYRTIDAKTEEFLKLSKKRQIKQGCVCAAISTALTVTVVVTVLLIYEYNVIAEARRHSHTANWLTVMNNSADDPNLLEILNKEKIDIDKTTLKLLPLLLKAINRNRYLEKIIEEPTSLDTPYEPEITTETVITRNIFADTRNWMKTPNSRLYTIEYKTSPIVYYKNPTRNIEYFTKIRKIRDYQRILNYVDKMISEKNYLGTTQPMRKDNDHTEKPYKMTTPIPKHKTPYKLEPKQKTTLKRTIEDNKSICKCSSTLSQILNKLLISVQQILSYFSDTTKETVQHSNNSLIQTNPIKYTNQNSTNNNVHNVITETYKDFENKLTEAPTYKTFLNRHKYIIDPPVTRKIIQRDYAVNEIMNLLKPSFNKRKKVDKHFESDEAFSTTNSYMESSYANDILKTTSNKPDYMSMDNTYAEVDTVTTIADYVLQKGTYDKWSDSKSREDDDYVETTETTTISANNYNGHNTKNLESINSNMATEVKNFSNGNTNYTFKGAITRQTLLNNVNSMRKMGNLVSKDKENFVLFKNIRSMRKMGKLVSADKENTLVLLNKSRLTPTLKQNLNLNITQSNPNYTKNNTSTKEPTEKPSTNNMETQKRKVETETKTTGLKNINDKQNFTNNMTTEEKALKYIEEAIMILNNETATNQVDNYNTVSEDSDQWEVDILKGNTSTKSMIPLRRSTFLEMQRNDWRHEDNDFDNDINYTME